MPQPICCKCRIVMRCEKNSFMVRDPEKSGFPSTYWAGDKWKCPVCGQEIVCGFSAGFTQEKAEYMGWTEKDYDAGVEALEFVYDPKDVKGN